MRILDLVLKHKWYDMISSGVKKEEYRDVKPFYMKRMMGFPRRISFYCTAQSTCLDCPATRVCNCIPLEYDAIRFHRGYTNTTMLVECKGIRIGEGNPDWGAVVGEKYFVISLGEIYERS